MLSVSNNACLCLLLCLTACATVKIDAGDVALLPGGDGGDFMAGAGDTSDCMVWRFTTDADLEALGGEVSCSVRGSVRAGGWVIRDPDSAAWRSNLNDMRHRPRPYVTIIVLTQQEWDAICRMPDEDPLWLTVHVIRGPPGWANIHSNEVTVRARDVRGRVGVR